MERLNFSMESEIRRRYRRDAAVATVPAAMASEATASASLEAALERLGPFGWQQRYTLALLCAAVALAAAAHHEPVFAEREVPFRCVVPECEGAGAAFNNATVLALLAGARCRRLAPRLPANHSCEREAFHRYRTLRCDALVYRSSDTVFAEFDLACSEGRALAAAVRTAALPAALALAAHLADMRGRRTALCVLAAAVGAFGLARGCARSYRVYLELHFLEVALGGGLGLVASLMLLEAAQPEVRGTQAGAAGVAAAVGGALLAAAAWRARSWRHVVWGTHLAVLLLPLCHLLLDESPRWLLARGRPAAATAALARSARWNKVVLDEAVVQRVEAGDAREEQPWLKALRSRTLQARLGACAACWGAAALVQSALAADATPLASDEYVDFALGMALEAVAALLLMMALDRVGRRRSACAAFLMCALACLLLAQSRARRGVQFAGRLAAAGARGALHVHTAELFPTRARCSALAACALVARLAGGLVAPPSAALRALAYGPGAALAALLVLLAPETGGAPLPADARAAELLGRAAPVTLPPTPAPFVVSVGT